MIMTTTIFPILVKGLTAGAAALQLVACSSPEAAQSKPAPAAVQEAKATGPAQHGIASIYTDHRTASGEQFSRHALAAAHKHHPLGCYCKVTNLKNGKYVVVRINDRGPYIRGRVIDLTPAAAAKLGFGYKQGLAKVKVERM
jgi:rare lipoprotein A